MLSVLTVSTSSPVIHSWNHSSQDFVTTILLQLIMSRLSVIVNLMINSQTSFYSTSQRHLIHWLCLPSIAVFSSWFLPHHSLLVLFLSHWWLCISLLCWKCPLFDLQMLEFPRLSLGPLSFSIYLHLLMISYSSMTMCYVYIDNSHIFFFNPWLLFWIPSLQTWVDVPTPRPALPTFLSILVSGKCVYSVHLVKKLGIILGPSLAFISHMQSIIKHFWNSTAYHCFHHFHPSHTIISLKF